VAELLFQVAHVRAAALSRARPVHSVDEAEEHVRWLRGEDLITHLGAEYYD